MTFINYASQEINCKVVYYGPSQGGKNDNLQFIYDHTASENKGKLISLATEPDRTIFFDVAPLELGNVRGFKTRFHLYTVPMHVFYDASQRTILKGVDGVVFVADSRRDQMEENLRCLEKLRKDLDSQGYDLNTIPYVLQLSHREQPDALSVEEMKRKLLVKNEPVLEAITTTGIGVFDTLKAITNLILFDLTKSQDTEAAPPVTRETKPGTIAPVAAVSETVVRPKKKIDAPQPSRRSRRMRSRFRYLHRL
jgi:signal recognition particle receptor subunit beta